MHTCSEAIVIERSIIIYNGVHYSLSKCTKCGYIQTMQQNVIPVDIYETGHYKVRPFFFIPFLINLPDYLYICLTLKMRSISRASEILDFGCGKGFFLYLLKKLNYESLNGLETSVSRAKYAQEITGLNISTEYYSCGLIMNKKYDCVSMIHVLEHIENPFNFLKGMVKDLLNEQGCIFIEVPNINSLASKIAGVTWAHFTPHFHVNHFTAQSFSLFCKDNNLKYEMISTFSFYNSAMGMTSALLSMFGYKGSLFEDMKNKRVIVLLSFVFLLPVTLFIELLASVFFKKGSVIKCVIKK